MKYIYCTDCIHLRIKNKIIWCRKGMFLKKFKLHANTWKIKTFERGKCMFYREA